MMIPQEPMTHTIGLKVLGLRSNAELEVAEYKNVEPLLKIVTLGPYTDTTPTAGVRL
jgi:hypothetical protein